MKGGNIFSDMEQNREETCFLSVSLVFHKNCSKVRQNSQYLASFRKEKKLKRNEKRRTSQIPKETRPDYTEAQRHRGGQGLRDEEAKGGNATRKIQKVLSWNSLGICTSNSVVLLEGDNHRRQDRAQLSAEDKAGIVLLALSSPLQQLLEDVGSSSGERISSIHNPRTKRVPEPHQSLDHQKNQLF